MKYAIATIAALSLFGCAGLQPKVAHVREQVDCYLDLAMPYLPYLTEEDLKGVVVGKDFTEILQFAGVAQEEILKVHEGLKACKNL